MCGKVSSPKQPQQATIPVLSPDCQASMSRLFGAIHECHYHCRCHDGLSVDFAPTYNLPCCFVELEEAICGLVDACLACPMYFYAPYILGHACVKIAEAHDTPLPFTGEHAHG